jgi:DNA-binding NarL/FixJ family response regulator
VQQPKPLAPETSQGLVTVLLVDDHALIRGGLRRALHRSEDLRVVAEAASAPEALALHRAHAPRVAVVDLNLGATDGLDLVRRLRGANPWLGIVVCTMSDGDEALLGALEAGASAFVSKSAPVDDVVQAARHAAAKPTAFTASDLAGAMRRRIAAPPVQLTQRESEVLRMLGDGLPVAGIAQRLYISPSTAKTHLAKLYAKLDAGNRTQAVMAAVRLGLLEVAGEGTRAAGSARALSGDGRESDPPERGAGPHRA